jgi:hypothetical protein
LTNFRSSAVNLIEEEHHGSLASSLEPLRWVPRGDVAISRRKTKQVTLGHLGSTALNNWKTSVASELVDYLRLTNAVTTANQNRLGTGLRTAVTWGTTEIKVLKSTAIFTPWGTAPSYIYNIASEVREVNNYFAS